jgi:hypothetical protein
MSDPNAELARFARGDCDPAGFPHREHVRMGFEMLRRHSFGETALHYSQALRKMAARGGRPEAYHETITIAFLSLIAERMDDNGDFEDFASLNPDLFDKRVLARWYRPERLASARARRTFILPEPVP